jgi:integrase
MFQIEHKIDKIIEDLGLIKKHWKIVEDRETVITNFEDSLSKYEKFAENKLKLGKGTITNQKSIIRSFLINSRGSVNSNAVESYLDSNESNDWKSNQLKALRRYVRDFLELGNWISEFKFEKKKTRIKKDEVPTDKQLAYFFYELQYEIQIIFLILLESGLRVGEVLKLRTSNIDFASNMIDASSIHKGDTKSAWISFFTDTTALILDDYIKTELSGVDAKLFDISYNTVQDAFKKASIKTGTFVKPHFLRTIFSEKCTQAGIEGKYIDAFCGRTPKKVLEANYTVYSPQSLRIQYDKVEPFLAFTLSEI